MEDMDESNEESISENRINTCPGTPFIVLSPSPSSSSAESTPYVIRSPSPIAAPDLAGCLCRFQMVQRGLCRSPAPQLVVTTRNTVRGISPVEPARPVTPNPDNYLWGFITPSTFLSISAFIPPQGQTSEPCVEDDEYLSILNWDQPVPGSQYAWVPFNKSGAPEPYSQELTPEPEPVARPSRPP